MWIYMIRCSYPNPYCTTLNVIRYTTSEKTPTLSPCALLLLILLIIKHFGPGERESLNHHLRDPWQDFCKCRFSAEQYNGWYPSAQVQTLGHLR